MPRSKRFFCSFFPVGRISLATLPPCLCGGGKSQTVNQRQVLMQGSARRCARGFGVALRVTGRHLPGRPPASIQPGAAASCVCQHSYFLGCPVKPSIALAWAKNKHQIKARSHDGCWGVRRRRKKALCPASVRRAGWGFPVSLPRLWLEQRGQGRVVLSN